VGIVAGDNNMPEGIYLMILGAFFIGLSIVIERYF
jgi:hypothetical protein